MTWQLPTANFFRNGITRRTDDSARRIFVADYEDSICPDGVASARRATYIESNQAMMQESDYCVFYYKEDYQPAQRKESRRSIGSHQPKSGTKAVYEYALSQGKTVINLFAIPESDHMGD